MRVIRHRVTALLLLLLFAFAGSAGCSSTTSNEKTPVLEGHVEEQIQSLLARYDLSPADAPERVERIRLGDFDFRNPPPISNRASSEIGFDLTPYMGKEVELRRLLLDEESQLGLPIHAVLIVRDDKVVGANLQLEGYVPDTEALNDKHEFAPRGLSPEALDFASVTSVELAGPNVREIGGGYPASVRPTVTQSAEVLALLAESTRKKGHGNRGWEDEEYLITLRFANGALVRAWLNTDDETKYTSLSFGLRQFDNVHFVPNPELKTTIKAAIGAE